LEHLIFITTTFQLNLLTECNILFIDGTFRSAPKSFYQVLNLIGHLNDKNLLLPIVSIIMKNKTELSYIITFENLKLIFFENNIKIDFNKIYFICDFEIALRNAIKYCFPDNIIIGCYFHYVKAIVNKFKELGLLKKNSILNIINYYLYLNYFHILQVKKKK
jgi:hypothetical protein